LAVLHLGAGKIVAGDLSFFIFSMVFCKNLFNFFKSDIFKKDAGCDYVEKWISLKFCTVKEGFIT
jgi:hypothetical protein